MRILLTEKTVNDTRVKQKFEGKNQVKMDPLRR